MNSSRFKQDNARVNPIVLRIFLGKWHAGQARDLSAL